MYQKMLIPLDGSELAEVVFSYAIELAGRLDLEIKLLLVASTALGDFVPMHKAYIEQAAGIIQRRIKEVRERFGVQPDNGLPGVHGEVAMGYPAEEILRYADENNIDLILMATHGRSGVRRWTMGNVADKVLRASKIPVLLIRAGVTGETPYDKWPKRTIIAPLDGSELAESVLPHVEALAKQRSIVPVEVVLIRVCEPQVTPSYYVPELSAMPLNWGEYVEQETTKCKQTSAEYLTGLEKRFKDGNINVHSDVLVGKAADEIVDYAQKNPFNIIVMATHGRSGISRWVYGSVADNVLQGVSSPVFLIRAK